MATSTPAPGLWAREDVDTRSFGFLDAAATTRLGVRLFGLHLLSMVLFITVVFTIPAWIFAALNITRSPKNVVMRIDLDARRAVLRRIYLRAEPGEDALRDGAGTGPRPLGLGAPDEGIDLPWSDVDSIDLVDEDLVFLVGGTRHEVSLASLTDAGRRLVADAVVAAWMGAQDGMTRSASEDAADLHRLRALKGSTDAAR